MTAFNSGGESGIFRLLAARIVGERKEMFYMADAGQRARRLGAKAARRKAIVAAKKKADLPLGMAARIRIAASCPIALCVAPPGLFETGIGHVILARSLPSGQLGCAFFLVDVFCLGVKDVFYREMPEDSLRSRVDAMGEHQPFREVDPALARKLINDSVAYAHGLGLAAASGYEAIEGVFGAVDAAACSESFTFGKDGKPFFVNGPNDTPSRIRSICATLQDRCGEGGWNYMVGFPGG